VAFYTYILASGRNGTLYVGSTDDLVRRVWEHKDRVRQGFTARYGVTTLVWYEPHDTREGAFRRERRIKEWKRAWKLQMIERRNPPLGRPVLGIRRRGPARRATPPPAHPGEGRDPAQVGRSVSW
jgi:putative endonuclease